MNFDDGDSLLCDFRQSRDLDTSLEVLGLSYSNMKCSDSRLEDNWLVGMPGYVDPMVRYNFYTSYTQLIVSNTVSSKSSLLATIRYLQCRCYSVTTVCGNDN